jgi:signal transduction histidine kinase
MAERPDQARELLAGLGSSTSAALRELKATVGLLRDTDDDTQAGTMPAPGLDQLPELVELTAFRIVQEALTNVTKHAVRPVVTITLTYAEDTFSARVVNTGARPGPAGSGGYGLIGMRERAHAVGGLVSAGPADPDQYTVSLTIPLTTWQEHQPPR